MLVRSGGGGGAGNGGGGAGADARAAGAIVQNNSWGNSSYEIDDEEPIQAGQTIATLKK